MQWVCPSPPPEYEAYHHTIDCTPLLRRTRTRVHRILYSWKRNAGPLKKEIPFGKDHLQAPNRLFVEGAALQVKLVSCCFFFVSMLQIHMWLTPHIAWQIKADFSWNSGWKQQPSCPQAPLPHMFQGFSLFRPALGASCHSTYKGFQPPTCHESHPPELKSKSWS